MKVNVNYKGKFVELDIPDEKLEELVKEQKKTGWEKPLMNQEYYFLSDFQDVLTDHWENMDCERTMYEHGNCFTSKELAENIARYQSLDLRIRRRIAEICEPVDWKSRTWKYDIIYIHDEGRLVCGETMTVQSASWNCDTVEHAKQIIEEFKDELTWYFTEFKDRMDG